MQVFVLVAALLAAACTQGQGQSQRPRNGQGQPQGQPRQNPNQGQPQQNPNQGQTQATTQGPRLLSLPVPELCANRPKQFQFNNHNYFFSWDQEKYIDVDPITGKRAGQKVDWLEARNQCRQHCMDAVGLETEAENDMIFDFMDSRNITYIWTSGRLCDFTGCAERKDLLPINIKGWFWSNTNTKMADTDQVPPGWARQPWSQTGHTKVPQPDNAEFDINQTSESCLGVLNNIYKDGIKWHDIACYHKKPFICEDNDLLLQYVSGTNPGIVL